MNRGGLLAEIIRRKPIRGNKVLVLLDWENLQSSTVSIPPEKFSLQVGLEKLIEKITSEVGKIVGIFVFLPPHLVSTIGERLKKEGFFIICCPKIKGKDGVERDTVDEELMRFGRKMIAEIPDLTHLCLGSGDQDFIPFLQEARHQGLKIILISGTLQSLSKEIIRFAVKDPKTRKRRVFLFLPIEEN